MKQMKDNYIAKQMKRVAMIYKKSILASLVFVLIVKTAFQLTALAATLQGNTDLLVSVINSLQFIFHLPIMNIIFPANVMTFFDTMIPIVMFDVLADIPQAEDFFSRFDVDPE
jgi:hypothetical protein